MTALTLPCHIGSPIDVKMNPALLKIIGKDADATKKPAPVSCSFCKRPRVQDPDRVSS